MAGTNLAAIALGLLGLAVVWVMIWLLAVFRLKRRAQSLYLLPRNYEMRGIPPSGAADHSRARR